MMNLIISAIIIAMAVTLLVTIGIIVITQRKAKKKVMPKKKMVPLLVEEDLPCLRGHKRLVDKAGGTKVLSNLKDSSKWKEPTKHSHYNVREYKVSKKVARKQKRAFYDAYMAEWCEPEYANEQ